jgi:hypothetical protein
MLSQQGRQGLARLADPLAYRQIPPETHLELRKLMNGYISYLLGRWPRTMTYLGG